MNGSVAELTHKPLDVVRWTQLSIDLSGLPTIAEVYTRVGAEVRIASDQCDERLLAVRITLTGSCGASLAIHQDLAAFETGLRAFVQGTTSDVWLEEIRVQTRSESLAPVLADQGSLADLLEFVRTSSTEGRLTEVSQKLRTLKDRLQSSAPELVDELGLNDEDLLRSLLPDVEETILAIALGGTK